MTNKVPPRALEMERSVLGALLIQADAVNVVADILKPEMFYNPANQQVYLAVLRLSGKGKKPDLLSVIEELREVKELEKVGGPYYVTSLTNDVVSASHLEKHSRKIIERYLLREMIRIGGELYTRGFDEMTDPFEMIEYAEKAVHGLTASINTRDFVAIDETLIDIARELETKRHRNGHLTGVGTGFNELDKATCGWQPSDLVILAARPKCGKTAFALSLALSAAIGGDGVGFFSMEMSASQLIKRVLANKASVYLQSLRDARLDDGQMAHLFENGIQKLCGIPFFIDDTAALSVAEFKSKARRMVNKYKVKLLVVDYLQLMQPEKGKKNQNREQEISGIARHLKIAAKELNVPIIALSQLSREVEKRGSHVPQLSDLRESGAIEQDADMVNFLYRPSEGEIQADKAIENRVFFKIAAFRNGEPRTLEFEFQGEYQRFKEIGIYGSKVVSLPAGSWKPIPKDEGSFPGLPKAVNYNDQDDNPF